MSEARRRGEEARWEQRFSELEKFVGIYGHHTVPRADPIFPKLRSWLREQQRHAVTGTLTYERWLRLSDLGVELLGQDERWERRFVQLLEYRERFGHCRVPNKWEEDVAFGHWVHTQRAFKSRGQLSAERLARLESIGFEWHGPHSRAYLHDDRWAQRFAQLVAYQEEHGHTQVTPSYREVPGLGQWVLDQREIHNKGALPPERRERLESIGFAWKADRREDHERWERRFEQLVEYRERFGHCRVPNKWKEDVAFGHWVHTQRAFKSRGTLGEERSARLESIGFEWHGSHSRSYLYDDRWAHMLAQLVKYRRQHGDTQVPPNFRGFDNLGGWVGKQREAHRSGTLPPDRRAQLEAVPFEWRGARHVAKWERRFAQLCEYRARFGHCRVPNMWKEDVAFGHWTHTQRAFKKAGKLSAERIRRLEEIGFQWQG